LAHVRKKLNRVMAASYAEQRGEKGNGGGQLSMWPSGGGKRGPGCTDEQRGGEGWESDIGNNTDVEEVGDVRCGADAQIGEVGGGCPGMWAGYWAGCWGWPEISNVNYDLFKYFQMSLNLFDQKVDIPCSKNFK
jgi:hypothetical protein